LFENPNETSVNLAARQYYILGRRLPTDVEMELEVTGSSPDFGVSSCQLDQSASRELRELIGYRVEVKCSSDDDWVPHTLIAVDSNGTATFVSDSGIVLRNVSHSMVRPSGMARRSSAREIEAAIPEWARDGRPASGRPGFPMIALSRHRSGRSVLETQEQERGSVLKRTWSALSVADSTRPVALRFEDNQRVINDATPSFSLSVGIGDQDLTLVCDPLVLETPPSLLVKFSPYDNVPGTDFSSVRDMTVIGALRQMQILRDKSSRWNIARSMKLFYEIDANSPVGLIEPASAVSSDAGYALSSVEAWEPDSPTRGDLVDRSRKLSSRSLTGEDEYNAGGLCEGLDEVCLHCMEAVGLLSEFAHDQPVQSERDIPVESLFANSSLSKKLNDQLEDALVVVGRALPEWCVLAPSFSPRVFSYESRRNLLERYAFGVSRSALQQQEAKTNVGRLRQRMASLRARAVELVGEAFSGGAEDPTALQLQADELYGMEEALAARVRAAFRAVKWQEHVLDVAKAVICRDNLLSDATAAMQRFTEKDVCHRRLEVRFEGESGFDAASGSEAGVTRGFYADVAESLLSTEHVAGVYCSTPCSYVSEDGVKQLKGLHHMDIDGKHADPMLLPLWIPDLDTSGQVVIPTPRADVRSAPGVFPRPLPHYHPQLPQILDRFRFMGRLFAAALRDGFMFPLPLSSSFLKLVQHGGASIASSFDPSSPASTEHMFLNSSDLPRAGFLGGEVAAAESFICKSLDSIDAIEPPLSGLELERRYTEIATDRKFARAAFGKSFDCSFEDYFLDRTFVDPLDPTQGQDAAPLCPNGYRKHVTIYNVREWVTLCKRFILHDGVLAQAQAFRRGVEDFFSADFLRLFTPEELQRDVCGVGDNVDDWDEAAVRKLFKLDGTVLIYVLLNALGTLRVPRLLTTSSLPVFSAGGKGAAEALVAVAAIGGEGGAALSRRFGPSSPTISYLVKALVDATPQQRRQFLNFVTSVPIVTPGSVEVVPVVSPAGEFLPMSDPSCLPRANTCARRLYLPKFESQESFSQVLWAVVREESKFKGFFEWRGN
jgi:hypothetical protein